MSGSGGGGGGGGYERPSDCETLRFDAQVTSPQAVAVSKLLKGDALEVAVSQLKGQTVVQVRKGDDVVGSLTGPDATRLRNCIEEGHRYSATVLAINSGQVRVRVEHV